MSKSSAGKGDAYRPVDRERYDKNHIKVFGRVCSKCKIKKDVSEFRHEDYSKPFEIDWLCNKCHTELRRKS